MKFASILNKYGKVTFVTFLLVTGLTLSATAINISKPKIGGQDGKTEIAIPISGDKVTYSPIMVLKGVIYFDIDDSTVKPSRIVVPITAGAVNKVTVSQLQAGDKPKTRVVLHLGTGIMGANAKKATSLSVQDKNIVVIVDNAALGKKGMMEKSPLPLVSVLQSTAAPPPPPVPPIERLVSVSFSQADLPDVIRMLASKSDLNIYAGPEVTGKVTIQVQNEPVGEVLKTILELNGYMYQKISDSAVKVQEKPGSRPPPPPPPAGPVTKVFAVDYANVEDIQGAIQKLLKIDNIQFIKPPDITSATQAGGSSSSTPGNIPTGRTKVITGTGTIIVTAKPDVMTQVEMLIKKLDQPIKQVMIEVRLVSVQVDTDHESGFSWDAALGGSKGGTDVVGAGYSPGAGNLFATTTSALSYLIRSPFNAGLITNGNQGNFIFNISSGSKNFLGAISAMIQTQKADLLADPKLIALNNTVSTFDLTEELPYVEFQLDQQTQTLTGSAKFDKKAGITLSVAPQITSDGKILLHVTPIETLHNGDVQIQTSSGAPLTAIPIIDTRKAEVTVMLKDGQTLVIGGLRKHDTLTIEKKIPWLADIPVLGNLFKTKSITSSKSELVIFVTPYIIPDDAGLTTEEKMMYDKVDFF